MAESNPFAEFKYYHYTPSLAAAVIFIIAFGLTSMWHAWKLWKTKTWYFIPFVIGGVFESVGYIGRAIGNKETPDWSLGPYLIQNLLLLVAPALFAASIYMVLARIIVLTDGTDYSIIKIRWLTKLFVTGDVISFFVQGGGGGMLSGAKTKSAKDLGENIIVVGLCIQVFVFGLFVVVAGLFHYRIRLIPTTRSKNLSVPWQQHLYVLYAASVFIMIRSIFRVAEYVMGDTGVLLRHEVYLYLFDSVLMFLVVVVFIPWHPCAVIPRKGSTAHNEDRESHDSAYPLGESTANQVQK